MLSTKCNYYLVRKFKTFTFYKRLATVVVRERVVRRPSTVCEISARIQKTYEMTSRVPVDDDVSGLAAGERDDGLSADIEFVAVFTAVPSDATEHPTSYCSTFASPRSTYYDTLSDSDLYADSDDDDSSGEFVALACYLSSLHTARRVHYRRCCYRSPLRFLLIRFYQTRIRFPRSEKVGANGNHYLHTYHLPALYLDRLKLCVYFTIL